MRWLNFRVRKTTIRVMMIRTIQKVTKVQQVSSVLVKIRWVGTLEVFSSEFILDEIDRMLLFELSQGAKTKDLPNFIPLSIAGIEKRKRHLKEIFDISKSDDRTLIKVAREKGFI